MFRNDGKGGRKVAECADFHSLTVGSTDDEALEQSADGAGGRHVVGFGLGSPCAQVDEVLCHAFLHLGAHDVQTLALFLGVLGVELVLHGCEAVLGRGLGFLQRVGEVGEHGIDGRKDGLVVCFFFQRVNLGDLGVQGVHQLVELAHLLVGEFVLCLLGEFVRGGVFARLQKIADVLQFLFHDNWVLGL